MHALQDKDEAQDYETPRPVQANTLGRADVLFVDGRVVRLDRLRTLLCIHLRVGLVGGHWHSLSFRFAFNGGCSALLPFRLPNGFAL